MVDDRFTALGALDPAAKAAALAALDEATAPLTRREMDRLFAKAGVPRSLRKRFYAALGDVQIVAIR